MGTKGKRELRLSYHLLLLLLISIARTSGGGGGGNAGAMSDLAKSLINLPSSWKPGTDFCQWSGVTCQGGQVTSLNLVQRSLSGRLPDSFNQLSSLQSLSLQRNQITGPLPSFSGMSDLRSINLDENSFTSIPADFFSGLTSLTDFSLDENPLFSWPLPTDLSKSSSLLRFSASNSNISGRIPDFIGELSSLQDLRLSYNNLSGPLPPSFAGSSIKYLHLNNQNSPDKLTGPIDVVASMTQLSLLWLQSNAFTGPIPDISDLSSLTSFNVRDNRLTGVVPASLTSCASLQNVTLSNNLLQGPFPAFARPVAADVGKGNNFCGSAPGPCDPRVTALLSLAEGFWYPASLAESWEGNNPCMGPWTGVVCDPQGKNIIVLNFANQQLEGTISPEVANLTTLTKLLLSNNKLSGPIPASLTGLKSLQVLDVSNNDLYGKIPEFDKSVTVKLTGNPRIGTDPPPGSLVPNRPGHGPFSGGVGPAGKFGPVGKSGPSSGLIIGIVVAALLLVLCSASLIYYLHHRKRANVSEPVHTEIAQKELIDSYKTSASTETQHEVFGQGSGDGTLSTIPIEELRKATSNFSEANILGRGGFGVVYKGELNGTLVAVKKCLTETMSSSRSGGNEEFDAEVLVLQKTRHRHLVTFLGYYRDNTERLLVYEYMSNGTLGQHLFEHDSGKYCALNLKERLIIALDVARGIEYLHSLAQESFIHRDLKPSNILLDDNLRAKVSDFGLVKLVDKEKSMVTRLAGTVGYLAPEYALTGKVSTKVDVYAFGLILMELITGKKVLDESLTEEDAHLIMVFRKYINNKEKFMTFLDPSLNIDDETYESVYRVSELACHCTTREPSQRPTMAYAVHVLNPLVDQWVPSSNTDYEQDSDLSLTEQMVLWQSDMDSNTFNTSKYYGDSSKILY